MRPIKYIVKNGLYLEDRDPLGRFPDKPSWAITNGSSLCWNKNAEPEWEPSPSNRDDDFLNRCRHTLEEAKEIAKKVKDAR